MSSTDLPSWFVFDLGNVVVRLAYERVVASICRRSRVDRDALVKLLEKPGGYRDLERGDVTFAEFHRFLRDEAGFDAGLQGLRDIWADFFDGPVEGVEDLLDSVRRRYRVGFLSNSNEIHARVIPRDFAVLFRRDDVFLFSHRLRVAKPDPEIFHRLLETLEASPQEVIYADDLLENVVAARSVGLRAFQFLSAPDIRRQLEEQALLRDDR